MDFPKTIGDNNMKINIIFYSFLFFLFSCKVEKDSNCNVLLRKAKENLNSFYNKNDADYLIASKIYLDSINCNSFKYKIFNTKTTILFLLKDYKEGIQYVSSLDSTAFDKNYIKSMYLNRFKALESESRSDTIHRNQYYNEGLSAIRLYMNEHPSDKETLCEYYLFKMLFTDRTEVLREVELLKKQEMYENEFLEVLIETINNFKKQACRVMFLQHPPPPSYIWQIQSI